MPGLKIASMFVDIVAPLGKVQLSFRRLNKMMVGMSAGLARFGRSTMKLGAAMAIPFTLGIRSAVLFEEQMAKVATMLDKTTMHLLPGMAKGVRKLAVEFGQSTATLTDGLFAILSAGIEAKHGMDFLTAATKLAVAGTTDVDTAVLSLTKVMGAFKVSMEEVADVSDFLFVTMKLAQAALPEVSGSLPLVTATAADAGLSMGELGASVAIASGLMPSFNRAAFSMRAALSTLLAPTSKAQKAAKQFGIDISIAGIKSRGFYGFLRQFERVPPDAIGRIFPRRAGDVIRALIRRMPQLAKGLELMQDRAGLAAEALTKRTATLGFQLRRLRALISDLSIELGLSLTAAVMVVTRAIVDNRDKMLEWLREHKKLIKQVAALAVGLIALGAAGLVLSGVLKGLSVIMSVSPFVLAAAAAVMLAEAFGLVDLGFTDFVENIRVGGHKIGTWMNALALSILQVWEKATFGMVYAWDWAAKELSHILLKFWTGFKEVVTRMQMLWTTFTSRLVTGWDEAVTFIAKQAVKVQISDPEVQKRALDNIDRDLRDRHRKRFAEATDSTEKLEAEMANADKVLAAAMASSQRQFLSVQKTRAEELGKVLEELEKKMAETFAKDMVPPDGEKKGFLDALMSAYNDAIAKMKDAMGMPEIGLPSLAGAAAGAIWTSQFMGGPQGPFTTTTKLDPQLTELRRQTSLQQQIADNTAQPQGYGE